MSGSLMTRSFSRREKLFMLILVILGIVGLYFFLIHRPITQRMEEIDLEQEEVLLQRDVAQMRLDQYNAMKAELDRIFAQGTENVTVMPEFDNIENLMLEFNRIFAGTNERLSYDATRTVSDHVIARTVRFSFSAESYDHARQVLTELTGTGYRCLLESVSLGPDNGDVFTGKLGVSGSITFYEIG